MTKCAGHPQAHGNNMTFKAGSYWSKLYLDYIYKRTIQAQNVDWDDVSRYHTNKVLNIQGRPLQREGDLMNDDASHLELHLYNSVDDDDMISQPPLNISLHSPYIIANTFQITK